MTVQSKGPIFASGPQSVILCGVELKPGKRFRVHPNLGRTTLRGHGGLRHTGRTCTITNVQMNGYAVGSGWADIVGALWRLCDENNVSIHQIKEKFGELRFYVGSAPEEIYIAIEESESLSHITCELCGKPGFQRVNGRGWVVTRCQECFDQLK